MNKKIITAIIIFVSMLFVSVVYAASIGMLSLGGTANFSSNAPVELWFVDAGFENSYTPGESEDVWVPGILDGGDNQTIYINAKLLYPGEIRTIKFKIENVEATSAILGALSTNDPDYATSGLVIHWPDLEDVVIAPGTTSAEYEILIEWDVDKYDVLPATNNFSATINYSQYLGS